MAELGVAVVGFGWMGEVHSRAYARLPHHYPQLGRPVLVAVAEADETRRADAVARYGFASAGDDWRAVLADDRVQAVSVTAPNYLHREIGCAVAAAGRHLWIEKPVGLNASDAEAVAAAVTQAGVQCAVGFNYRNAPAVAYAHELISSGAIGTVTSVDVQMFTDYAADPAAALSWRFARDRGGNGVLGDLMSHAVDLARFLAGPINAVVADTGTVIATRPRPSGVASHYAVGDGPPGPVENDDRATAMVRFASGAGGSLRASRVAVGDQNNYGVEVRGTRGRLAWDFRRMGELQLAAGAGHLDEPTRTVLVGPGHGDLARFQPAAGIAMSYDDLKVIEAARFVESIATGTTVGAGINDAVAAARINDAIEESAKSGAWVTVG